MTGIDLRPFDFFKYAYATWAMSRLQYPIHTGIEVITGFSIFLYLFLISNVFCYFNKFVLILAIELINSWI